MFNTDRGLRRKRDFVHAICKMTKCDKFPWYDNLHQYFKNKIHCSCCMCQSRSGENNSTKNYRASDRRKLDRVQSEMIEELA